MTTPTSTTRTAPPVSAWAPFTHTAFRNLWLAQLGSNIGSWMQSVGAQWFILETTHSSALTAWVQTAALIPVLFLSLTAGVLADALNRRILLIVTTLASTIVAAGLWFLAQTGTLSAWSLLLITFVLGCLSALTNPAWQAIQPELVPRAEIPASASLSSVTVNGARAIGPALAGVLVSFGGPALVFGLNAVSFLGVTAVLLWWKRPPAPAGVGRELFLTATITGLRYVRAAPGVRRILLRAALFALPACVLWALLPTVANQQLHLDSSGYGLLLGVLGAGAVLGVFVMPVLNRRVPSSWVLAGSALLYAAGLLAPTTGSLPVVCVAFLSTGLAWIATLTTLNAGLQLTLAGWVRARGMGVYLLVFMGGQGVASFAWGIVADLLSANTCFLIAATLLLLVAATVPLLPLHPNTGKLDRTITALTTSTPTLLFDPDSDDGPVITTITYTVPAERADEFLTAMHELAKSRRRTGASRWTLTHDATNPALYREEYTQPSWAEHLLASQQRWTGHDHHNLDTVTNLLSVPPTENYYRPIHTRPRKTLR